MAKSKFNILLTHRVAAIGAIGVLGVLILGGIHFAGKSVETRYAEAADRAQAMYSDMTDVYVKVLDSQRAEKDFLLHSDDKFVDRIKKLSEDVAREMDGLKSKAVAHHDEVLAGKLDTVKQKYADYIQHFSALAETRKKLGYNEDSGLEGTLRDSVHAIETKLKLFRDPDLTIAMLMMRRHEKDFMMRRNPKYGEEIQKRGKEFLSALGVAVMAPADADELKKLLADYQREIKSYIGTTLALAAEQKATSEIFGEITPVVDEIKTSIDTVYKDANEASTKAQETTALWIGVAVVGVAISVLGAALLIGRSISRPVSRIAQTMEEVAAGDLDVEVPGTERSDEVGRMAKAVLVFKEAGLEKLRLEAMTEEERRLHEAERERNAQAQARAAEERAAEQARAAQELATQQARAAQELAEQQAAAAQRMAEEQARAAELRAAEQARAAEERAAEQARLAAEREAEQARLAAEQQRVVELLAEGLRKLADGDLTHQLSDDMPEGYRQIAADFNAAVNQLRETIGAIASAAHEVTNAAGEISMSTTDLSQRTEEQAASLEETSASMEQIAATVKNNAENAQQANQLVAGARTVADRSGEVVTSTIEAMARIEESSRRIGDIIGVIDEIARQTNLLALNAAVEAARAGEAGRGFEVVASEVRSLAQRSSHAAKDIKDLIVSSNMQVKDGVELVHRTGTSLSEIVASVKRVADIVGDIANASAEQAGGLDQINKALTQMDEVTQQNSALVEQNAATARTLEQQAGAMTQQVSAFRLDGTRSAHAASSAGSAPARQSTRPPVARMRGAIAAAFKGDPDFAEF